MLETKEIEVDDSRNLFSFILQCAIEFERKYPGPWDQKDYPGDYMELFHFHLAVPPFSKFQFWSRLSGFFHHGLTARFADCHRCFCPSHILSCFLYLDKMGIGSRPLHAP